MMNLHILFPVRFALPPQYSRLLLGIVLGFVLGTVLYQSQRREWEVRGDVGPTNTCIENIINSSCPSGGVNMDTYCYLPERATCSAFHQQGTCHAGTCIPISSSSSSSSACAVTCTGLLGQFCCPAGNICVDTNADGMPEVCGGSSSSVACNASVCAAAGPIGLWECLAVGSSPSIVPPVLSCPNGCTIALPSLDVCQATGVIGSAVCGCPSTSSSSSSVNFCCNAATRACYPASSSSSSSSSSSCIANGGLSNASTTCCAGLSTAVNGARTCVSCLPVGEGGCTVGNDAQCCGTNTFCDVGGYCNDRPSSSSSSSLPCVLIGASCGSGTSGLCCNANTVCTESGTQSICCYPDGKILSPGSDATDCCAQNTYSSSGNTVCGTSSSSSNTTSSLSPSSASNCSQGTVVCGNECCDPFEGQVCTQLPNNGPYQCSSCPSLNQIACGFLCCDSRFGCYSSTGENGQINYRCGTSSSSSCGARGSFCMPGSATCCDGDGCNLLFTCN